MDIKNFQYLTYDNKKAYLIKLFFSLKEIYPIYRKYYEFLSIRNDLNEDILNKIYEAVWAIASETSQLDLQYENTLKAKIKNAENLDQDKVNKSISDIEKSFI